MNRDRGGGGRGGGGGGGWGRDGQMDLKVLFISLQGLNLNVSMFKPWVLFGTLIINVSPKLKH